MTDIHIANLLPISPLDLPPRGVMLSIAEVVKNYDKAEIHKYDENRYATFHDLGNVQPLRDLLILYGDPTKQQDIPGVIDGNSKPNGFRPNAQNSR